MLKSPENRKLKPIYLKRTLTLEDNDPLKVLFYDKEKASKDAKNLLINLKNLNKDQLEKFINTQNLEISQLKDDYQEKSKKYSVAESAENKFWARLKTSLAMGFALLPLAIFVSFMIAFIAPPIAAIAASALYLTYLAYCIPIKKH